MVGGIVTLLGLFSPTLVGGSRIDLLGFHPNLWGLVSSGVLAVSVSLLTGPPPEHLVKSYFGKPE